MSAGIRLPPLVAGGARGSSVTAAAPLATQVVQSAGIRARGPTPPTEAAAAQGPVDSVAALIASLRRAPAEPAPVRLEALGLAPHELLSKTGGNRPAAQPEGMTAVELRAIAVPYVSRSSRGGSSGGSGAPAGEALSAGHSSSAPVRIGVTGGRKYDPSGPDDEAKAPIAREPGLSDGEELSLDLSLKMLRAVPPSLGALSASLVELVLTNNQLTAFPQALLALPRLRVVSLAWNSITELPDSIAR